MSKKIGFCAAFLLWLVPLAAQVAPAGEAGGGGVGFWIGASISTFNPDYGCADDSPFSCGEHQLIGVSPYLDTNYFLFDRVGAEGEMRFLLWHGPATLIQTSYLAGPRVRLFRYGNLNLNAKFLLGQAHLDVPGHLLGGGSYFAYAPGIAIDYRVATHVAVRVEYEYQRWPGYKCWRCGDGGVGGLNPNGLSSGVSYAIHRSGTYRTAEGRRSLNSA